MTEQTSAAPAPLLQAADLTCHFTVGGLLSRRKLHAVDDVNLSVQPREIVALVGESGSGKSTIARLIARVYRPTRGEIRFEGRSITTLRSRSEVLGYRGEVPMVFQDPYSSINPAYRVSHGIARALRLHRRELSRREMRMEMERVLTAVGLTPASDMARKFPHELSGGQRQRLGFAQALALKPKLIVADEPVSMLDVSIRAGILNLMLQLREREGVSILYITHDLASARYVADRIVVMYAGHVVEHGAVEDVLSDPRHPYTQLLLSAVPDPHAPLEEGARADAGEPPRVIDPREGCRFTPRCPLAIDVCSRVTPQLLPLVTVARAEPHSAACHVAQRLAMDASSPASAGSAETESGLTLTPSVRKNS